MGDSSGPAGPSRTRPARPAGSLRSPQLYSPTPSIMVPSRSAGSTATSPNSVQIMYDLPAGMASPARSPPPTPRPGGMLGVGADGPQRIRSPPTVRTHSYHGARSLHEASSRRNSLDTSSRPPLPTRRSSDYSLPAPMIRTHSDQSRIKPPGPPPSVFSARPQSVYSSRNDVPGPKPAQLHAFAHHCRVFYFSPDPPPESERYIDSMLATHNPAPHRAIYLQIQAACRALAHLHQLRMRIASFHASIAGMTPSGSLTPHSRTDLAGKAARLERKERLRTFIDTWCSPHSGVEPFFKGLWAALRVQSRGGIDRGGAGARRVVWEIDDAVFMEAGGMEFMRQALDMLKGVLGFEDVPLTAAPKHKRVRSMSRRYPETVSQQSRTPTHPRSGASSPLKPAMVARVHAGPRPSGATHEDPDPNRHRSGSDPFEDQKTSPVKPRSTSGRGPAPPVPHARKGSRGGPIKVTNQPVTIPNPLQPESSTPLSAGSLGAPLLSPSCQTDVSSHIDSPLLPEQNAEPSPIEAAFERAVRDNAKRSAVEMTRQTSQSQSDPEMETLLDKEASRRSSNGLVVGLFPESTMADVGNAVIDDDNDDYEDFDRPSREEIKAEEIELSGTPRNRLWTMPAHLSDEEIDGLMALFPTYIQPKKSGRASSDVRFPFVRPGRGLKALESGAYAMGDDPGWESVVVNKQVVARVPREAAEAEEGAIRYGTGRMWTGLEARDAGWQGGSWFAFCRWWRRLFGIRFS